MREIKFRAWDTRASVMVYSDDFDCWVINKRPESWVRMMQYTGLHDKNGKEIYEGDIVTYPLCTGEPRKGVVEWTDWGTGYEPFTVCGKCGDVPQSRAVEVVGNIYENPELIEKP